MEYSFRNLYEEVLANATMSENAKDKAEKGLQALDKKNSNRSSKPSKTAIANEPIKKLILDTLATLSAPITASDMGVKLSISTQKASSLLIQLVKAQEVEQVETKVPNKGKVKAYSLAEKCTVATEILDGERNTMD